MNQYYYKGLKAKELLNLNSDKNPYPKNTREHELWHMGNKNGVYAEYKYQTFVEERNAEIILGDDIH